MTISPSNIERVSQAFDGGDTFDFSVLPTLSLDGTKVVFESRADNLVSNDFNGQSDIFLTDLASGTTSRVSELPGGNDAFGDSYNAMISGDGGTVVFESNADGFVGNDFNGQNDVFAKDLATGNVVRASLRWDGTEIFGAFDGSISNDGRYVTFQSFDSNVTPNDFNGWDDVFVRDLVNNTTMDVSNFGVGGSQSDFGSYNAAISGDGQFVVFESMATNLVNDDFNGQTDIFVRNLQAGTTEKISQSFDRLDADNMSYGAAISDDGRYVAYSSQANNITSSDNNGFVDVFLHDRDTGTTTRITDAMNGTGTDLFDVAISPDGMIVTYTSYDPGNPFPQTAKTYAYDQNTGETTEILANGFAGPIGFSGDNTVMAFGADVDGLTPDDANGMPDVFVAATGIEPPPIMTEGVFTDGDDMMDLNLTDLVVDNILDYTNAMGGSDTIIMAEEALQGLPFFGGDGNDMIVGSSGNNFISGDDGNDTLVGEGGDDSIVGGQGWDLLFGGDGDDSLMGGADNDRLYGDADNDQLNGGGGDDQLIGGSEADTFVIAGSQSGMDTIQDFSIGEDLLLLDDVLGGDGTLVIGFADLDTDFNGMIDESDAFVTADAAGLTLDFMGGSVTLSGIAMMTETDLAVA